MAPASRVQRAPAPTRRLTGLAVVTAMVVAFVLPGATAAAAPPARPQGLAPSAVTVDGHPRLTWAAVPEATSYDVQVATDPGFTDPLLQSRSTVSQTLVVDTLPPAGGVWWRVRAVRAGEASTWTTAAFTQAAVPAPTVTGPEDGATVPAPVLQWEPTPGADRYEVHVSTTPPNDQTTLRTTFATALVPTSLPGPGVQHWRVRAVVDGHGATAWSAVSTFELAGPPPVALTGPAAGAASDLPLTLTWAPAVGADTYDVQVGDETFADLEVDTEVAGTSFTPGALPAGTHHWRVRPSGADWAGAEVRSFTRTAPPATELLAPGPAATVTGEPVFSWSPVASADTYTLEVSPDDAFAEGTTATCTAVVPRFTPASASSCWPPLGEVHWRVTASSSTTGLASTSEPSVFSYEPSPVIPLTPAPGELVAAPVLTWEPMPGAERYLVNLTLVDGIGGGQFTNRTVTGTSLGPGVMLGVGATYRWSVQAVHSGGRKGPLPPVEDQPTFVVDDPVVGEAATPEALKPADGSEHARFPLLTWEGVDGADVYRIAHRLAGAEEFVVHPVTMAYPAGTITSWTSRGTFDWRIQAYDRPPLECTPPEVEGEEEVCVQPPDVLLSVGEPRTLTVTGAADPAGLEARSLAGAPCGLVTPDSCSFVNTPLLAWDAVPDAGRYEVEVSTDPAFVSSAQTFVTESTRAQLAPLPDSLPGAPYHWRVRSCTLPSACSPWSPAVNSFTLTRATPALTSPSDGGSLPPGGALTWEPVPGSSAHVVELSTDPDFDGATTRVTTGTSYAPPVLPAGTHHWRVAARNGAGIESAFSASRSFVAEADVPDPDPTPVLTGTAVLTWAPTVGATSYDVEVRAGDTVVAEGTTAHPAFAPSEPLAPAASLTWRVRAVDAQGGRGAWSAPAALSRPEVAPVQTAPTPGALIPRTGGLFTWEPVSEAELYRFERRRAGAVALTERVTTGALAHSPASVKADGFWEWRVVALDDRGAEIGSAPWRAFVIDGQRPSVTRSRPAGPTVKPSARFRLFFSEPVSGVSSSSVVLKRKGRPGTVRADVSLASSGTKVVLVPRKDLQRGATYVVKVKQSVEDQFGLPAVPFTKRVTVRR